MEVDVNVVFAVQGRLFECFHARVQAHEGDGLPEIREKITRCIERDLFPDTAATTSRPRAARVSRWRQYLWWWPRLASWQRSV